MWLPLLRTWRWSGNAEVCCRKGSRLGVDRVGEGPRPVNIRSSQSVMDGDSWSLSGLPDKMQIWQGET